MKTMKEVREYLRNEQAIASDPGTPEWQVATTLLNLANSSNEVQQFIADAQKLPLDGPSEEAKEARNWRDIMLDSIENQ